MASYAKQGDLLHIITLSLSALFAVTVVLFAKDNAGILDKEWIRNGFCVSNEGINYLTSHDLAFYADVFFSIVTIILWLQWRKLPQTQGIHSSRVPILTAAVVGHGLAHGALASGIRKLASDGEQGADLRSLQPLYVRVLAVGVIFWVPMMYAVFPKIKLSLLPVVALIISFFQQTLEEKYGFTYVQTVLMVCFSLNELCRVPSEKQWEYARYPLIVGLPVVICGWIEAVGCSAFYQAIGGHVWYDATIAVSTLLFYIDCYLHGSASKSKEA